MFSSKFLTNVLGDGSRTNKYDVLFNIDGSNFDKKLNILCQTTAKPGVSAKTINYTYKGKDIPIPVGFEYSHEWSCTFLVDDDHNIIRFFEDWIERYDSRSEGMTMSDREFGPLEIPSGGGTFSEYVTNVKLIQYDFNAEFLTLDSNSSHVKAEYELYNVFPTEVRGLAYNQDDEIASIEVSFKFSHFKRVK